MRSILITFSAFVVGVLLTLLVDMRPTPGGATPAHTSSALVANSESSGLPTVDDAAGNDFADLWPTAGPSPEQVLYAQPRMMRDALARLTPRVAGKPNLYLLAFAGDGAEDVFRHEAEYAATLFTQRFGATTHAVILENNPDTLTTHPLANWSNLEAALAGLSSVMHPEQDILLLYVTTHGDEEHDLLVDMGPLPLDQIGATDLAGILDEHPFKWKVLVINACYSGGFVPPLRGRGTLVLTAARADRSSFGCGSDSDVTYFGRAWLVDALNHTADFIEAFHRANGEIRQWEQQDQLTPSEPQIDIGSGIAAQLASWREGFTPGAAVPFKPAAASASTARSARTAPRSDGLPIAKSDKGH